MSSKAGVTKYRILIFQCGSFAIIVFRLFVLVGWHVYCSPETESINDFLVLEGCLFVRGCRFLETLNRLHALSTGRQSLM